MSLLMDLTLRDFSNVLASNEPAPGGGSIAALSGVIGSSLAMMVVNLSIGKKSYESLDGDVKAGILRDFQAIKKLNCELTDLVDEDTKAFNMVMEAMKMPKESEIDKINRMSAMDKAGVYALKVPLLVAEKCFFILKHQIEIAKYGNKNAVSDIGVGALLALAGLEGAALNVKINIPSVNDEKIRMDASKKIDNYIIEGNMLKNEIVKIVNMRMN